jgi:hypothetical protein
MQYEILQMSRRLAGGRDVAYSVVRCNKQTLSSTMAQKVRACNHCRGGVGESIELRAA